MSTWTATPRGNGNNKTTGNTYAFSPASNMNPDTVIILRMHCDNSAASGASPVSSSTVTDTQGNTWTRVVSQNRTAASAPNDGLTGVIWATLQDGGTLTTSDTITVTFNAGVSVPAKTYFLTEFSSDIHPKAVYSVDDGGAQGGTGTAYSFTTLSVPADGVVAVAGGAAYTGMPGDDTDTTRGSWAAGIGDATSGGVANTNVCTRVQHKAVTSSGTQTHNGTIGASSVWVGVAVIISALPPWTPYAVTTFV